MSDDGDVTETPDTEVPHEVSLPARSSGLPKFLVRDGGARLQQLTGITNRKARQRFFANPPVRRWAKRIKLRALKASPLALRLFYSSAQIRNIMLLVAFQSQNNSGPSPRVNRDVHSLDYQILLSHFPALLEGTDLTNGQPWDREAVIGTLASVPEAQKTLVALVEDTLDYLQHLWRVWPPVYERLVNWSTLADSDREVVILGLLVLITIRESDQVVDLAQSFAAEIRSEFSFLRVPTVPSSPDSPPSAPELTAAELWKQGLGELLLLVSQAPQTPELAAIAPLRFQLSRMEAIAQRAEETHGISAQEFAVRVRKQAEWQNATWLTPALENLEHTWEQVPVERRNLSPQQVRDEVLATLTKLLNIHTQRFSDRTQIAQEMADIEAHMPRDLEGLRKAREQLRTLRTQLYEHDTQCGDLELEILSLLASPQQVARTEAAPAAPETVRAFNALPVPLGPNPAPDSTPAINTLPLPSEGGRHSDPALPGPPEPPWQGPAGDTVAEPSAVLAIEPAPSVLATEPAPALEETSITQAAEAHLIPTDSAREGGPPQADLPWSLVTHGEHHRVLVREDQTADGGRQRVRHSPFSLGDEFQIAGFLNVLEPAARPEETRQFTISLVFGSQAAGLEQAAEALASLHQIERDDASPYRMISVPADETRSLDSLRRWTQALAEDPASGTTAREPAPRLLLIPMPWLPQDPGMHAEILEHVYTLRTRATGGTLRAVLLFNPSASWQWLSGPDSAVHEGGGVNVHLRPWSGSALHVLLSDLKMMHSPGHIKYVQEQTGGWFTFLETFIHTAQSAPYTDDPARVLASDRDSLASLEASAAQQALRLFGVSDIPHVRDVFAELIRSKVHTEFDAAVLRVVLDEKQEYAGVPAEVLLAWGLRLGVLSRVDGTDREQFRIDPTVTTLLERTGRAFDKPAPNAG